MTQPFPYASAEYVAVACNLCEGSDAEIFCRRDRNGLPVQSVICRRCGLMYLSPRMTPDWYARYYDGEYRAQMARFKGTVPLSGAKQLAKTFATQTARGRWLVNYLRAQGVHSIGSALDVGSSTGGLLASLRDAFGCRVLGVEPSPEEAAFASQQGIPTQVGLFENFQPPRAHAGEDPRFDLVLCTQSFNHLLDPMAVSRIIRDCLRPGGWFFLECQDFFAVCQGRRAIFEATQIDHVYMFVPATLRALVERAGFSIRESSIIIDRHLTAAQRAAHQQYELPRYHVRFLATPAAPAQGVGSSYAEVRRELEQMPNAPLLAHWHRGWQRLDRNWRPAARRLAGMLKRLGVRRRAG